MTSPAIATAVPQKERLLTVSLVAVALGVFMMQLDATVVNLALPQIGTSLNAKVSGLQWVIDGYTLPLASFLLIGGRLGDRFGHRRVFLAGLVVFGVASALCAAATNPASLITARFLQGVGAAIELPATLALLARTYPAPALRAKAIGIWASVAGLSLAVGPLIGGNLVDDLGWRSVFLINLPVVALAGVLTWRCVAPDAGTRPTSLDVPGQLSGTASLALITYAVITGPSSGWASATVLAAFAAGAGSIGIFLALERRAAHPLLPPDVFHHRVFVAVNLSATVMGFVLFGLLFTYSLYFQQTQHDTAASAGYRFLPLAIAFILTGPIAGRLGVQRRPRSLIVTGLGLLAVSCAALAALSIAAPYLVVGVLFAGIGIGYGLLATSLAGAAINALPPERAGLASALNNTGRQLGGVLGVAFAGGQLAIHNTSWGNPTTPVTLGFAAAAIVALIIQVLMSRGQLNRELELRA